MKDGNRYCRRRLLNDEIGFAIAIEVGIADKLRARSGGDVRSGCEGRWDELAVIGKRS